MSAMKVLSIYQVKSDANKKHLLEIYAVIQNQILSQKGMSWINNFGNKEELELAQFVFSQGRHKNKCLSLSL